jgi:LysR family glycine cleavage system transcriptional activator
MKNRTPPWAAIEAFIAAAHAGSFKDAAATLGLSPPAFTRRIQLLEHQIGVKLFDRDHPTPVLTVSGKRYLKRLKPGYEAVREATDWMSPEPGLRPLRLGISESLATSWLVPRLARFYDQAAGIDLVLRTRGNPIDLVGGAVDVGILFGRGNWANLISHKLFGIEAFIVSAQVLVDDRQPPHRVEDIVDHRLLEVIDPPGQWQELLTGAGYDGPLPSTRTTFDSAVVLYEAASQGLGLALGMRPLVDPFLARGRLTIAMEITVPMSGAYYMVATPEARRHKAVQILWRWVAAEALRLPAISLE